jgi:hypothetical protein
MVNLVGIINVSESLIDMGVTFINDIDVVELEADLNKFMLNNKFSHYTVSVDVVRKEQNWLGRLFISYLNGATEEVCVILMRHLMLVLM